MMYHNLVSIEGIFIWVVGVKTHGIGSGIFFFFKITFYAKSFGTISKRN
jgi:hypothetical protein